MNITGRRPYLAKYQNLANARVSNVDRNISGLLGVWNISKWRIFFL